MARASLEQAVHRKIEKKNIWREKAEYGYISVIAEEGYIASLRLPSIDLPRRAFKVLHVKKKHIFLHCFIV